MPLMLKLIFINIDCGLTDLDVNCSIVDCVRDIVGILVTLVRKLFCTF